MRPDHIVGYTFSADLYCPPCVTFVLPVGPGEAFDGWGIADGASMDAEEFLDGIAQAFGIDRHDESSFDTDEFPKVVFADQVTLDDACGRCHLLLL